MPVHNVTQNTYYATIQAGAFYAMANDSIAISAGTYYESDILVNVDGIVLSGDSEATTIIMPDPTKIDSHDCSPTAGDPHNGFVIAANQVTIRNMTIDGGDPDRQYRHAIVSRYWIAGGPYDNTIIQDVTVQNIFYRGIVLRDNNNLTTGHRVLNTTALNGGCSNQGWAILGFNADNMEIKNCYVEGWEQGIGTGNYLGTESACNIEDNEVVDIHYQAYTLTHNGTGSVFSNNIATFNDATNHESVGLLSYECALTVENNIFTGAFRGVSVGRQDFAKDQLVFTGNSIAGTGEPGSVGIMATDIEWGGYARNFTVNGDTITNYETGIMVDPVNSMTCDADIHMSSILATTYSIVNNDVTDTIHAEDNWYGDETGPYNDPHNICGLAPEITGNVSFFEWWADAAMTTRYVYPDPGFSSCPSDVTLNQDEDRDPYATGYAVADPANCYGPSTVTYTDDLSSLDQCNTTGTIVRTFTVTDYFGHTSTCQQTITIEDNIDPVLTVPADITVDNDPGECGAIVNYNPTATDFGFFQGFENATWESGYPYNNGVMGPSTDWNDYNSHVLRVATGTDGITSKTGNGHAVINSGNLPPAPDDFSGIFSRLGGYSTVFDSGFIVTQDVYFDVADPNVATDTYGWDLSCAANNQSGAHLRDFVFHTAGYGTGVIAVGVSNGSSYVRRDIHNDLANYYDINSTGWYTLQWTFHNDGTGILAVEMNLLDDTGTVLWTQILSNAADDIATIVGGNRYLWFTFVETGNQLAIDNTSLTHILDVDTNPVSGSFFDVDGSPHTVTCTVADDCGNTVNDTFTVTVNDTEDPVAVCQNITVELDENGQVSIDPLQIDNGSTDNCAIDTYALDVTDFTCDDVGDNLVTLTVTDVHGNSATCQATVTVEDNIAPTFTVPADITIYRDADCQYDSDPSVTGNVEDAADNCGIGDITYSDVIDETDPCHVYITRTWTVTDVNGNVAPTQDQIITVEDNTPPTFTAPADITIYKDENCGYDADPANTGDVVDEADNCGVGDATYVDVIDDTDTCFLYITRTWSLVDDCGNAAEDQVQYITVTDSTAPVTVCQDITIELDEQGFASIIPSDIDGGSTDNCGISSLTASQLEFDCSNVGENTVTLTAMDFCGNESSCDAIVTVEDNIPPEVTVIYVPVFLDENGYVMVTVDDIVESVYDNCGIADMWLSQTEFYCEDVGFNSVDLTVVDVNGNETIIEVTIGVFDQIAPTLEVQDVTVYLDENGQASIEEEDILVGTWDNCEVVSVVIEQTDFTCDDIGFNVVHVYIEDASGNEASDWAIVTVVDEIAPTIVCPDDVVVEVSEDLGVDYYEVQGDEFDPVEMFDNCFIETVSNSFNGAATLDGAQLPVGENEITWTVTDQSGNTAECTFTVTVTIVTGIATHELYNVNIYPNPVNTTFKVDLGTTFDNVELMMMDINGKIMMKKDYKSIRIIDLDGTTLPNGVYMIRISNGDASGIFRIVKQ